jgi:AcrR family transcriptional regulator
MARPRKHDQSLILDAVERVISRDGVVTVEAVAKEAGVSKATVLYEHPSKRELIAALVTRTIAADDAFNAESAASFAGEQDALLRGRIEAARRSPPSADGNPTVLGLVAALMQDGALRAIFRAYQTELGRDLLAGAADTRSTRLAWLALEGLKFQQHLGFHEWSETERAEILNDIETLASTRIGQ